MNLCGLRIGVAVNIKKNSAKNTLFQIVIFLVVMAVLILVNKNVIANLYTSGEISKAGMIINAVIVGLFLLGLFRIVMVLFRYISEHQIILKLVELLKENATNPASRIGENSLIAQRYNAIRWVSKQGAPINHAAMAASTNALENSRLTLIRFVHSTLILAGVFGTVVSLSMALIGSAGLLNSPEGVKEMGTIISSMSSALSSTVTAIVCFFIFAYFYLRLNDARIQLLTSVEDVTSLYLLPKITHTEDAMVGQVTELTKALKTAAEKILEVEQTFISAGDRLQHAVNDLQGQVSNNSIEEIKDLIRKGFHLSEPEYDVIEETKKIVSASASNKDETDVVAVDDTPLITRTVMK